MLLVFIIGFLLPVQSTDPYTNITNQVNMYLENIQDGKQVDVNFWAINELYSSNCRQSKIVEQLIFQSRSNLLKSVYSNYECSSSKNEDSLKLERLKYYALETGSILIAIHYLSQSETSPKLELFYNKFNFKWSSKLSSQNTSLLKAIKDRASLSAYFTDYNAQLFTLYSLLYSDYVQSFFSAQEFDSIIKKLSINPSSDNQGYNQSLQNYSLLKAAYETNRYQYISTLYDRLIKSNYYPNSEKKVGVFSGLDFSLSITGNYSESLYLQRNVLLPLAKYYNLKPREDIILLQQSANLYDLGKYNEAKKILEGLYNDLDSTIPRSQLFNNLSLSYQKLGEKNRYTTLLLQAVQELEDEENLTDDSFKLRLGLYRNLFVYYVSIGDTKSALPYIEKAQNIASLKNDKNELAAIYLYLGNYYWNNFKDSQKALNEYHKADSILIEINSYRHEMNLKINRTNVLIQSGALAEAASLIPTIKQLASENSDSQRLIEALLFEADIALVQNNITRIQSIIDQIKTYSLDDLEFEVLIKYHNLSATLLHKNGLNREAYSYFKPIIDQIIDRAKGSVDTQTGFWTVEEEYLDAFELMISILTSLESTQESIAYLDRLKTINDASLYNNPLLRANKLTEKELAEEKKITAQIQNLRNEYLSASSNEESSLKTEIDKLSAQKQVFVNKVNNTKTENNLPLWKIQQQISGNELILHYTELNNSLYASSISKSSITIDILPLNSEIKDLLTNTANDLASGKTSLLNLFEVFNFLKLQDIPDHITQISVIPDNELYRIPLDVLPTKVPNSAYSFGSAHYLIEDFDFKYFTSLQDYAENNRIPSNNLKNDFSAFAISYFDDFKEKSLPSLPFATSEVREIQEVLTAFKQKRVFSGNSATEEAFQKQLNTSRILHVATHSEVSTQDPLFSTIYLKSADANGTEGDALYAYELFDNQLNNELIMLNSCSSGTGNYLQGTGIMGISRALRYAGAKSLALNLWEVNDKIASEFATDFYYFLNEGFSKSESMRFAKINQIKTGSADPHYWGAYTLIGNSSPIIKKPTSSQYVLPFLLAVGLLVGYRVRSKSENSY